MGYKIEADESQTVDSQLMRDERHRMQNYSAFRTHDNFWEEYKVFKIVLYVTLITTSQVNHGSRAAASMMPTCVEWQTWI